MKILFLGTPSFGVPALKEILMSRHEVLGVVCQPDKVGNHNKVSICDVKRFAIENNIKVYQFDRISRDGLETVQNIAPDLILTAAFGQILSQKVLDIPKFGVINIHGSILPKLRGAAPIQRAIIDGNTTTGITIMKTVYAVDAGDVLAQESIEIGENETSGELFMRMSQLASKMIVSCLDAIENGTAVFTPQKAEDATFCSKITAEQEVIDWNNTATLVHNIVRALNPSPIAWTTVNGVRLKIFGTKVVSNITAKAGSVVVSDKNSLVVACGEGAVSITELQIENGKHMDIKNFNNGRRIEVGAILGEINE